jgi:lipoyl-dependent peroxiredoxin
MPVAERTAEVTWEGNLTEGAGVIESSTSGAIQNLPVTWAARTEAHGGKTSPEELIAAAHAACYAMAFSNTLNKQGTPPERLHVSATVAFDRVEGAMKVTSSRLDVQGRVPGMTQAQFEDAAREGERGCPVSNALRNNVDITVNAQLE